MDQQNLESIIALACEWAQQQEEVVTARGVSLGSQQIDDAHLAGVQNPARVRVLVVERIPFPDNPQLAQAALDHQILTTASRGCTFGYGIMIRADCWGDRELLAHNLVHVAQFERCHDLQTCIREFLYDRAACAEFTTGSFEEEARHLAREICSGKKQQTSDRFAMLPDEKKQ